MRFKVALEVEIADEELLAIINDHRQDEDKEIYG